MNTQTQTVSKLVEAICAKDFVTADKFFTDLMRVNILEAIKIQESEELKNIGSSLFLEAEEDGDAGDDDALAKIDAEIAALAGASEDEGAEPESDDKKDEEPKDEEKKEDDKKEGEEPTAEVTHDGETATVELEIENDEDIIAKILKAAGVDEENVTSDEETKEDDKKDEEPKDDESKADDEKDEESDDAEGEDDEAIKWFDGGNPAADLKTESVRVSLYKKR